MNSLAVGTSTSNIRGYHFNAFKQNNNKKNVNGTQIPPATSNRSYSNTVPIVSTAVAIASLGIATYALIKKPSGAKKLEGIEEKLNTITRELTEGKKTQETLQTTVETIKTGVDKSISELSGRVDGISNGIDGRINGLGDGLNEVRREIGNVKNINMPSGSAMADMPLRVVRVNDMDLPLARNHWGYGVKEKELTEQLQTESTRRMLGAVKPIELPENAMIRIPTAEFQGFAKTGGLATVPRELVANLGAVINNKQKAELIVDTPMYLGQVENNVYFNLVKVPGKVDKEGHKAQDTYRYVRQAWVEKEVEENGQKVMKPVLEESDMARLTKIDTMNVEIFSEAGRRNEQVNVYLSDTMYQKVSFDETLEQFNPETADKIRASMALGQDYDTQLVKFIAPKPSTTEVTLPAVNGGKPTTIKANFEDAMAQLKPEEAQKVRDSLAIGKDYEMPMDRFVQNKGNQLKIFDDESAGLIGKSLDAGKIAQENARQLAIKEGKEGADVDKAVASVKVPMIKFVTPKPAEAKAKFRTVLYENRKFQMDGPVTPGKNKNIYNDQTFQAGETERFVYFNKFMYENLLSNHKTSDKPLRADWIIGNDWHTGPITAMMRLLTPARKASGLEPSLADKVYNTPTTTLMHNFKLRGSKGDGQQAKFFNIMFGEHAAKIVENAHMPKDADLPSPLWNGLLSGQDFNPQTMAMAYADDIVFVSKGNFMEASTRGEKGGINYELAALRGRQHQYGNRDFINKIGMKAGIAPEEISPNPTARGITNGSDRVNHIITQQQARVIEKNLGLEVNSLISDEVAINNPYEAHQHNKGVYLRKVISDLNTAKSSNGQKNPMKIHDWEHTDLTGVDENTPVFGIAGRIVDQKGLDIDAEGILQYYQRGHFDRENPPVFYRQGTGDMDFVKPFMEAKAKVREICPKAADRMMFAELFSEKGRYDGAKMMTDFVGMPSKDEPCGLVHKENGYTSGALSIVNTVGGLTDGLKAYQRGATAEANKGATSIFVPFRDMDRPEEYWDALHKNGESTATGFETAIEWFNNKPAFEEAINESYRSRFDWQRGKIQEYISLGKTHGAINDSVSSTYNA